ncbi:LysR family transcriptional regulator (plasmid) [Rhizobium rosettiformans]|uniref:LysR family transcriptional regulator n=1 Tax=Rhizobium rosettiformans TaxID=1368430 RepID=A0ABX7F1A8_9HYPH|nr:LysR family transcriptional regulator [Rhizobium rosettiformans]QRF54219.1 LysR family transcriptional regulator [Rhizobium rosettiformans]
MRYRGLDLNLLVALDALLRTQNVSRAASAVHVTQPAMSSSLARLRAYFGDPLLITRSGKSVLSPLAQTLAIPVSEMLRTIDRTIITQPSFDPSVDSRSFSLLAADTVVAGFLAKALQHISQLAPNLCLDVATPHGDLLERLDAGRVDLIIAPEVHCSPNHPKELLLEEDHRVIACRKTFAPDVLTLEQYAEADHVEVFVGASQRPYLPERLFSAHGFTRRISVKLDNFSLVPFFLSGTERLATFPGKTAELYMSSADLKLIDPPFLIPPARLVMQWHSRANADQGLNWLRTTIRQHLEAEERQYKSGLYRLAL